MKKLIKKISCGLLVGSMVLLSSSVLLACGTEEKKNEVTNVGTTDTKTENNSSDNGTTATVTPATEKTEVAATTPEVQAPAENTAAETTDPDFKYIDKLLTHENGKKATYVFEAENTDLGGKSGPDWSGFVSETGMISKSTSASNGAVVRGMCQYGNNVYFLVVCDRDVEDATLTIKLGADYIPVTLDTTNYAIRVDTTVPEEDLDETEGSVGNWDKYFLYYEEYTAETTGRYLINSWECGSISINKADSMGLIRMGDENGYVITSSLKLKKGVNCISLITANSYIEMEPHGTLAATGPIIDCIEITTEAQLGMYVNINNGYGTNGCWLK